MELDRWVQVFDRLLPRSRACNLVFNRVLRKFFHGLSILPKTIHEHLGSLLLEAFPQTTSFLLDHSYQIGNWTELTADELEAEMVDTGGQSPGYLQDTLHSHGFPALYVHEWWDPSFLPTVVLRNPIPFVDTDRVLVNDLAHYEKHYLFQFGDYLTGGRSQFVGDESVYFGAYDGWFLVPKRYHCPNLTQEFPLYYYICGENWPDRASIYESELRYLLRLIYKQKPCHLRCILRVNVLPDPDGELDGDIQDTTWEDDDIYDTTSALYDILNDHT